MTDQQNSLSSDRPISLLHQEVGASLQRQGVRLLNINSFNKNLCIFIDSQQTFTT